jgi:Putative Actinobacterial Holin-X, holin superfamily III
MVRPLRHRPTMISPMAHDSLRDTPLVRAVTDVMADLSDLVQKEVRLAGAEITHTLSIRLRAGVWFAVAGLLATAAFLLMVEGLVFVLLSLGLPLQWSCFVAAAVLVVASAVAFRYGRARSVEDLTPTRTARQFNEIMRTAKE